MQNSVQQSFFLASCLHQVWAALSLSPNAFGKPCQLGENLAQHQRNSSLPAPVKSSSPISNFHVITQYKLWL